MPLMVYTFLVKAIEKYGRPVTTSEVQEIAREELPMCVDHVIQHLVELDRKGIIKKRWDDRLKSFVWIIPRKYTIDELIEKFPELYSSSLYYHLVRETLGNVTMEEAMKILYKISRGSSKRLSLSEIRNRLKEIG